MQTSVAHAPVAYYGFLHEDHGTFLMADNAIHFLHSDTGLWETIDLPTFRQWGCTLGNVAVADMQLLLDGNRVARCSKTLQAVAA